jgi:hypothetical protein
MWEEDMANTTDILITTFFDDEAIKFINSETGLCFRQVTDGKRSGGPKILSFEAYGTCVRCIGRKRIDALIDVFHRAQFTSPEYAVMLIDDDDDAFNGIVTHNKVLVWDAEKSPVFSERDSVCGFTSDGKPPWDCKYVYDPSHR